MPRAPRRCPHGDCDQLIRGSARYCPAHDKPWAGARTKSSQVTSTWAWQKLKPRILERDGYECQLRYVGICTRHATTVDHRKPVSRGGDVMNPDNLQSACRQCNEHKARTSDRK